MEIINEKGLRILVAKDGCVIQSVTDGSILGKKLVLGKKVHDGQRYFRYQWSRACRGVSVAPFTWRVLRSERTR